MKKLGNNIISVIIPVTGLKKRVIYILVRQGEAP
ncbi:hypothetical protein Desgi_3325 [Desulfoscipio gibsoniae DSM 7213]|uniref:Uncharacterized protein n=1 Tax=Desulfoscipio gibsoniae DSM 7213 TaxID=767817 RepID=R4KSU7_9FIRM|nr:hypothetical protein Desgi_3325 [Desulfoscipio gibsoniae DSM 7213]